MQRQSACLVRFAADFGSEKKSVTEEALRGLVLGLGVGSKIAQLRACVQKFDGGDLRFMVLPGSWVRLSSMESVVNGL